MTETGGWESYLVPGSPDALRNSAGLTDPVAIAIFERVTAAQAELELRTNPAHPATFDLAHLSAIHRALFTDVYPFAGELRRVDLAKPGQSGEPFVHHAWIQTYTGAVAEQLHREGALTEAADPASWADRAGYYWAALTHAHPYREGNGRAIRIWLGELAEHAGHPLDWRRATAEQTTVVAVAAAGGEPEPMRALLTAAAGGALGSDRPRAVLDGLDRALRAEAWARTGLVFGSAEQRQQLRQQLPALTEQITALSATLAAERARPPAAVSPPAERWYGLAASLSPSLTAGEDWPVLAGAIEAMAAGGGDVATRLAELAARDPLPAEAPARALLARLPADVPPTPVRPPEQQAATAVDPAAAPAATPAPSRAVSAPRR